MNKEELKKTFLNEDLWFFLDVLVNEKIITKETLNKILLETDYFEDSFDTSKSNTLAEVLDKLDI